MKLWISSLFSFFILLHSFVLCVDVIHTTPTPLSEYMLCCVVTESLRAINAIPDHSNMAICMNLCYDKFLQTGKDSDNYMNKYPKNLRECYSAFEGGKYDHVQYSISDIGMSLK